MPPHIIHITRSQLRAAIEVGIAAAFEHLTGRERVALRAVGKIAAEVGGNFEPAPGCPLVQAGLWNPDEGYIGRYDLAAREFYRAYDDVFEALRDSHAPSDTLLRVAG